MNINVNLRLPICKQADEDFLLPILVDVLAPQLLLDESPDATERDWNEESTEEVEFLVGRVWAERLEWFDAEQAGFDLLKICDQRSGTWAQVLDTLSSDGQSFRRDLQLDDFIPEVVFIHEILLHPEISDRIPVVDAVIRGISTSQSILLMHYEQAENYHLDDREYHELGFKKIARSNLLLRDNHYRYPFAEKHAMGRDVPFSATAEHEEWLLERWEQLVTDHPSL